MSYCQPTSATGSDHSTEFISCDSPLSASDFSDEHTFATPVIRSKLELDDIDCCSEASDASSVACSATGVKRKVTFSDKVQSRTLLRKVGLDALWFSVRKSKELDKEKRNILRDTVPAKIATPDAKLEPDWWRSHEALQEARANALSLWDDLANDSSIQPRVRRRARRVWPALLSRDGTEVLRFTYGTTRSEAEFIKDDARCGNDYKRRCSLYRPWEPVRRAATEADKDKFFRPGPPACAPRKGHVGRSPVSCGNRSSRHLLADELIEPG